MKASDIAILVVDDENTIREGAVRILEKEGWQAAAAVNGTEGLGRMAEKAYYILLLDLMMPGISGMEVLQHVRKNYPDTAVIVITGYATIENAVEAMKAGAYDFIAKPFTPDQLRIVVGRAVDRLSLMQEAARLQEEKKKHLQDFIDLVSHELRSPLTTIQQQIFTLLDGCAGAVTEDQQRILSRVQRRLGGLGGMVKNLLDLSCIEAGQFVQNRKPVALKKILQDAIDLYSEEAESRNISIKNRVSVKTGSVLADRRSLEIVFSNLVSNAIHYNRDGGAITVRARTQGGEVSVTVADTGVGIADQDLPRIFDKFVRIRSPQTRMVIGSGLGLPLAKSIIEAHSGTVAVHSTAGKGTAVTVRLPKAAA